MHYATEANQNPICVGKITLGRFFLKFAKFLLKMTLFIWNMMHLYTQPSTNFYVW